MSISPDTMRALLVGCMAGMALLAAFYLRRRDMSTWGYIGWGLLALLVPLLGPFLVVLHQPGRLRVQVRQRHFSQASLMAAAARRARARRLRARWG